MRVANLIRVQVVAQVGVDQEEDTKKDDLIIYSFNAYISRFILINLKSPFNLINTIVSIEYLLFLIKIPMYYFLD